MLTEPLRERPAQHQPSRRQFLLIRRAERAASPFARGVRVSRERRDEGVEDVLLERDGGRAVWVGFWEGDLETEDGVGVGTC